MRFFSKVKPMMPQGTVTLALIYLFHVSTNGYPERGEFKVKENGTHLEVTSPWGTKTYTASTRLDVMKNYRIEIPLSDLEPVGAEDAYDDWFDPDDWIDGDLSHFTADGSGPGGAAGPVIVNNNITLPGATPTPTPSPTPSPTPDKKTELNPESDDTARLMVEANRFYNQGRYYESLVNVEEVLRRKPKFVRAWIMKGSLLYVQGHRDLAHDAWSSVLNFDPENKQISDLLQRYKQ